MDNAGTPLARLTSPCICQHCRNLAYWRVHSKPLCYIHLRDLAETDKGIAAIINDALISPELLAVSMNEIRLRVYPSTCVAPICALLNHVLFTHPDVDREAEIVIEYWEPRSSQDATWLNRTGMGYYQIDSCTRGPFLCNAPMIKLFRAPQGRMAGFMKMLNDHSVMVRRRAEEEAEYGKAIDVEEEPDA